MTPAGIERGESKNKKKYKIIKKIEKKSEETKIFQREKRVCEKMTTTTMGVDATPEALAG